MANTIIIHDNISECIAEFAIGFIAKCCNECDNDIVIGSKYQFYNDNGIKYYKPK